MNERNKILLARDPFFKERLGVSRVIHFTHFFSLWSGIYAPFFEMKDYTNEEGQFTHRGPV